MYACNASCVVVVMGAQLVRQSLMPASPCVIMGSCIIWGYVNAYMGIS